MSDRFPPPSEAFPSRVLTELLPVCVFAMCRESHKHARSDATPGLIGESELERAFREDQTILEFRGPREAFAERVAEQQRSARSETASAAKRRSTPDPKGTTRNDAGLLAANAARGTASSGSAKPRRRASLRSAQCGARLRLLMGSRMIPEATSTGTPNRDLNSGAGAPRSDARSAPATALVDAAVGPDVYEPITLVVGSPTHVVMHGGTCTPHCESFREFLCRGDHV